MENTENVENNSFIIARCDASYKEFISQSYIGIGISISQDSTNLNIVKHQKYTLNKLRGSYYAESLGIIELLKNLRNFDGEKIIIISDNDGLIHRINHNKSIKNFPKETRLLYELINKIKETNEIKFKWENRQYNKKCDLLSRLKNKYSFSYELLNKEIGIYQCHATCELEAQEKLNKFLKKANEIKPKKSLDKMIKEFRKKGIAYA